MNRIAVLLFVIFIAFGNQQILIAQETAYVNYIEANCNKREVKIKMRDAIKLHTTFIPLKIPQKNIQF